MKPFLLAICISNCCFAANAAEVFKIGAAAVDITPEKGTPMAGYYQERAAQGTHDPLMAKAIVMADDRIKVALVALDLISTTQTVVDQARKNIEKLTGIPETHVMISATHAHTGPVLAGSKRF